MYETKIESLKRQIEETKLYIKTSERELLNYNQRLEAFECLLKEEIEKEAAINLITGDF